MMAIQTRYHGPTNHRGSRVSARTEAHRIMVEWDDALDSEGNHDAAASALIRQLGWATQEAASRDWYRGASVDGRGYTYVRALDWAKVTP